MVVFRGKHNVKGGTGRRISTTKKMRRRVGGETSLHVVDGVDTSIPFNTVSPIDCRLSPKILGAGGRVGEYKINLTMRRSRSPVCTRPFERSGAILVTTEYREKTRHRIRAANAHQVRGGIVRGGSVAGVLGTSVVINGAWGKRLMPS